MTKPDRSRWIIVALVFVAIMLNYVDRQILALLKPTLEAEFRWSDSDYANMVSAFQFAAAVAFLGTGWFIDRVGLRRRLRARRRGVEPGGHGACVRHQRRGVHRRARRAGRGGIDRHAGGGQDRGDLFHAKERSIALGIGNTAPNIGAIVTPLVVPALAVAFGWQAAFLVAGGLGLVWVAVWFRCACPVGVDGVAPAPIRWTELFAARETRRSRSPRCCRTRCGSSCSPGCPICSTACSGCSRARSGCRSRWSM